MRTKEIDVWVNKNKALSAFKEGHCIYAYKDYHSTYSNIKAKLIIELPERKATITEKEFDEFWGVRGRTSWHWRKHLFGDEDED